MSAGRGYVWSRWAARPVEHVRRDPHGQPNVTLCGRTLHPERIYVADRPSGLAPLCRKCARRAG